MSDIGFLQAAVIGFGFGVAVPSRHLSLRGNVFHFVGGVGLMLLAIYCWDF